MDRYHLRAVTETTSDIPEIDVDELECRLTAGAAVFDVREPDEYEAARIPGVTLVPLATVPASRDRFSGPGSVYVVCAMGGRSARAVEHLRACGIDAVNVVGGTVAWAEAGKPIETGPGPL